MKQLHGIPSNIKDLIIGRITHTKVGVFNTKSRYIIVSEEIDIHNYAASISSTYSLKSVHPLVHSVTDVLSLNDGDIVAIYPDGRINVIYEYGSFHNTLFITERCNANCIMCPQPPNNKALDNYDQVMKSVSLMDKATKHLVITGGEPTLIGDKLFNLIKTVKEKLPKTSLTLLTNAIKLSDFNYAKNLALINHPELLIDIPLYSDTDTEHNKIVRVNGFNKTIEGIYNLAKLNQKVGIRIVIHRLNFRRLPQMAEFIYRNFPFVSHIAFMQMENTGYGRDNLRELWIDPYDYNNELEKAIKILLLRDLSVSIYNSQLCILPESIQNYAKQSISPWKNIYLPICNNCNLKADCAGFFETSKDMHSKYLKSF